MLERFEAEPALQIVTGRVREFLSPELATQPTTMRAPMADAPGVIPGGALLRRSVFATVGPFDERSVAGAEYATWIVRARALGVREAAVDAPVLERRLHGRNLSLSPEYAPSLARALKAGLDVRRGRG
jgi:hypothetical protein